MAKIIGLPKLSPTMEEGTLVAWTKQEGDEVDIDDLLAEVETDKATMEFRSFDRGVLLKILVPEGETLEPDVPVAIIGERGEDISELLQQVESERGATAAKTPSPEVSPDAPAPAPAPAPALAPTTATTAGNGGSSVPHNGGRILSSPLVRRLAREHGVDLATVSGSGPRGRVVKRDIVGRVADGGAPGARPVPSAGTRLPPIIEKATSMRRTIARRLTESAQNVPHYYLTIDIDAEPVWEARQSINAELDGEKVSLNDLLIKACAVALRRYPAVNSSWVDGQILRHQVVDISVAVAVSDGLMTPVVRDADRKGVLEISREVRELAALAKERRLQPEDMTGGTFSISNLGMFGIEEFTAVINPPEGAILAVGTIRQEPIVNEGTIVPGRRMRMTMSCDHRIIDGAVGAEFLALLKRILESPFKMLL